MMRALAKGEIRLADGNNPTGAADVLLLLPTFLFNRETWFLMWGVFCIV
jgi:hypothetical protein